MPARFLTPADLGRQTTAMIGAGIDWANPLTRALVFATPMNRRGRVQQDLVTRITSATGNGPTAAVGSPWGYAPNLVDANGRLEFGDRTSWRPAGAEISVLVAANPNSEATVRPLVTKVSAPPYTNDGFALLANSNTSGTFSTGSLAMLLTNSAGAQYRVASITAGFDGLWHVWGGTVNAAGALLYKDGVPVTPTQFTAGAFPAPSNSASLNVGYCGTAPFDRGVAFAFVWFRALSASEMRRVSLYPLSLFALPTTKAFLLSAGGAGGGGPPPPPPDYQPGRVTVFISEGTAGAGTIWQLTSPLTQVTPDTTATTWAKFPLVPLTTKGDLLGFGTGLARLPVGSNGLVLQADSTAATGLKWVAAAAGTVTSVQISGPSLITWAGNPITGAGTFTGTLTNQNANLVLAGPASGAAAAPTFRSLVDADLPAIAGYGGRLSLSSTNAVAVDNTGNGTVYYKPYTGQHVRLYNGTTLVYAAIGEFLTNTLSDATKNPAATSANNNYDLFVWNDAGTVRLGRGPAWSSSTSRGTGAGSTAIETHASFPGIWVNAFAITNGPAAQRGTYLGTFRTNASNLAQDSIAARLLWNYQNQTLRPLRAYETTASWNYTTDTWRQARATAANQVDFLLGLDNYGLIAHLNVSSSNSSAGVPRRAGLTLDGTGAPAAANASYALFYFGANDFGAAPASYCHSVPVGYHYLAWVEKSDAVGTTTWYGSDGNNGITAWMMA